MFAYSTSLVCRWQNVDNEWCAGGLDVFVGEHERSEDWHTQFEVAHLCSYGLAWYSHRSTWHAHQFSSGISRSQPIDKLGMHSSDTVQVFFEDVRVPAKNIIGEEGAGFTYQMVRALLLYSFS